MYPQIVKPGGLDGQGEVSAVEVRHVGQAIPIPGEH